MNQNTSKIVSIILQLLLCACIVVFFGRNSLLRPAAYPCLYKEYLSGLIVVSLLYLNALVVFPHVLGRYGAIFYVFLSIAITIIATLMEFFMVFPQIRLFIPLGFTAKQARLLLLNDFALMFMRNTAFWLASFFVCELKTLYSLHKEQEMNLLRLDNKIIVKNHKNNAFAINVTDIDRCVQNGNYTTITLKNGNEYYHYGSLNNLQNMLGEEFDKISRNTLVRKERKTNQLVKSSTGMFINGKKQEKVYKYIASHPNCRAPEIIGKTKLNKSMVFRIIARLKQQGLIEHVGSNKTGGYRVVED